jgi:thioredoxin reductase
VTPDLVIVGAGPAGATAALVARSQALSVVLLESADQPGGQLHRVFGALTGVPGASGAGATLAASLARQLAEAGQEVRRGSEAVALAAGEDGSRVTLAGGASVSARAVLIATGLRNRILGVPGEREMAGKGVSWSGTRDRDRYAGQPVAIVGGGDAAFENALMLAAAGCPVTLVVRGEPRARPQFRDRVTADPNITVLTGARPVEIVGQEEVTGLRLATPRGETTLPVAAVFVKIGQQPNTEWCGSLDRDPEGFLRVDANGATSARGVWAAGDVTRPSVLTVAAAAAGAASAVNAIRKLLRG